MIIYVMKMKFLDVLIPQHVIIFLLITNDDGSCDFSCNLCIWSDDFSDPSTWVTDYDPFACNLEWEIGTGLSAGGFSQ